MCAIFYVVEYICSLAVCVYQVWKAEKEAEMKAKLAESSRYKSYRRYMKNNKQQMTFGPE